MKNLIKYLKPYTKESILAPLFKLLEVAFDLMVPVVVAKMIDTGVAQQDYTFIFRCAAILLAMALLGLLCSVTAQFLQPELLQASEHLSDRRCLTISRNFLFPCLTGQAATL